MKATQLIIFAALFAAPAAAQVTLFEDDFSHGLSQWTAEFPWHAADPGDFCLEFSNPAPGLGTVARMGETTTWNGNTYCHFDSVGLTTAMTVTTPIAIPAYADEPVLSFESLTPIGTLQRMGLPPSVHFRGRGPTVAVPGG